MKHNKQSPPTSLTFTMSRDLANFVFEVDRIGGTADSITAIEVTASLDGVPVNVNATAFGDTVASGSGTTLATVASTQQSSGGPVGSKGLFGVAGPIDELIITMSNTLGTGSGPQYTEITLLTAEYA